MYKLKKKEKRAMQCPTHYQFGWRPDRSIGRSTWDGIWWGRSDPFASRRILVHRSCQQILQQHDGENLVKKSGRKQEFEGGKSCQIIQVMVRLHIFPIFISRSAHRTPNFTNPEFHFPQFTVYFDINLKLLSGKKYSKSKQTKYSGFVKLGVRWAERKSGM